MYKTGILVMSDKGYKGEREDRSGQAIREKLNGKYSVEYYKVIPDEQQQIMGEIRTLCDEIGLDLLLTTGGTGLSNRDVTPEATMQVIEKLVPGIPEAMRYYGMQHTPKAMLSRGIAGVRGKTLIINLPGSVKGVNESMDAIMTILEHALDILLGSATECGQG